MLFFGTKIPTTKHEIMLHRVGFLPWEKVFCQDSGKNPVKPVITSNNWQKV